MKRTLLIPFVFLLLALLLAGCGGGPSTMSWPGVTVNSDTANGDGTIAYVAYNAHVYAVNLANGAEIWRYPKEADAARSFYAAPALTPDGQLIVGGYDHALVSLNPETGAENWKFTEAKNRYVADPLVTEKGIFAPNADGTLYALDFKGASLWAKPFKVERPLWAKPSAGTDCECIYVAAMDHRIYAINPADGSLVWKSDDLGGAVAGAPVYEENGLLYAGTFGNQVVAIDPKTGKLVGKPFIAQGWVWHSPALVEGQLYFGDLKGNFYILNSANLAVTTTITGTESIIATPLVISDTIVYVTEGTPEGGTNIGTIQAIQPNGDPVWKQNIKGKLYATPVLAGSDTILVPVTEGESVLVAFSLNGAQKWTFLPK